MDLQHKQVICNRTRVFFPFEPYETQKHYMKSVVEALDGKQNALLESPTGTGKTLSLLCSSLAWLQSQTGAQAKSVIYYTSRTHMQLSQAAKELKKTAYCRHPAVVIGSRVQMCLNDEVRSADPSLINRTCRNAIARNACSYHTNYEQKLETLEHNAVHDIEDLANFGKKHQCCPYYASKKLAETKATTVFMPYNYLLDTSVRKSTQLKIDNSVIIFDEAHNIEGALKDCVSGSFTESSLHVVQESCDKLPAKVHEALNKEKHGLSRAGYNPKDKPGSIVNEFAKQKSSKQKEKETKTNPIEELAEKLTNEKLQKVRNFAGLLIREIGSQTQPDKQCSVETIFNIMDTAGVRFSTSSQIISILDSMASFWSIAGVMNPSFVARHVSAISNLSHVLTILFPEVCNNLVSQKSHQENVVKFYTVFVKGIYDESTYLVQGRLKDREVNFWCLHPAIGLKKVFESTSIYGPRSMIVTSGTLAPMRPIQKELEMDFQIQRSFEHVIDSKQLKILLVSESFKKFDLKSDFASAQREKYPEELGNTLLPMTRILPYGTLIFFPSYSFMNKVIKVWKSKTNIWRDMSSVSSLYMEQGNQDQFLSDVAAYKRDTSSPDGSGNSKAIFFCVCRGKLSEGINLEGNQCRTVIIVGLPFPSLKDPRVESTKKFHESRGNQFWYSEQMRRALNQTIGRVIRSRTDFGLLLLVDPRYKKCKYNISEWTRNFFPSDYVRMSHLDREVKSFFNNHGIQITQSAGQSVGAFEIGYDENWSPFSEEDDGEAPNNRALVEKPPSAQERQNTMLDQYRAARERLVREPVAEKRKAHIEHSPKRQKTTLDAFNSIYAQSHSISSAQIVLPNRDIRANQSTQSSQNVAHSQDATSASYNAITSHHVSVPSEVTIVRDKSPTNLANYVPDRDALSSQATPAIPDAGSSQGVPTTQATKSTQGSQATNSSFNYSITKQASDKDRPTTYTCCICKNEAIKPNSTMCPCDRIGCQKCLMLLAGKKCFKCGTMLRKRNFKPRLFKSAFYSDERTPVIVVNREH